MDSSSPLIIQLNKLRQLSRGDRILLFKAAFLLPVIHVALILVGYARLSMMLKNLSSFTSSQGNCSEHESIPRAREIARIVSIASQRGLYRATCLRRSMVTWWFLGREGIDSVVCFGVRMSGRRLEAHAWVECNGVVINDAANIREQFHVLHHKLVSTSAGL
jgi:hypothetical protein